MTERGNIENGFTEEKVSIYVAGMTCATCAKMVERELSKVDGVSFAAVNLATDSAFVVLERPVPREVLERAVREAGYDIGNPPGEGQEEERYRAARRGVVYSWSVVVPLMVLMVLHMYGGPSVHAGAMKRVMQAMPFIEAVCGAFVLFGVGRRILRSAWIALSHRHANMDVLVALGALSAWGTVFVFWADPAFPSFGAISTMIVALHLTGRYIESRLRDRASKQVRALLSLSVPTARLLLSDDNVGREGGGKEEGGRTVEVPIEAVKSGNVVVVLPGERIAVDGEIVRGTTSVDESMLTGESIPVSRGVGDAVTGGSLNLTGALHVRATSVGEDSFLSRMASLIREAQGAKIPIQAFADRVTNRFVPVVFLLAVLSGAFWWVLYRIYGTSPLPLALLGMASPAKALNAFISTLVIACPCALGLAIPMALVAGTGAASKRGLLIRNAEAVQTARELGAVILDKTGTLTEGAPKVVETNLTPDLLTAAASIERSSTHPLAKAISAAAAGDAEVSEVVETAGEGVRASVGGREFFIGRPVDPDRYGAQLDLGRTVVEMRSGDEVLGFIAVEDPIREDTLEAVRRLREMGVEVVMATGDNERTARSVAARIGVDDYRAALRPDDKLTLVRDWQARGRTEKQGRSEAVARTEEQYRSGSPSLRSGAVARKVLMAGDGINDAAALKGADIGVAMGAGSDLAVENADIVIVKGGVSRVADAISLSRRIFEVIRQNLFWAFAYNVVAVPLAMLSLLNPIVAESAMAASSISVILSSMRIAGHFGREDEEGTAFPKN